MSEDDQSGQPGIDFDPMLWDQLRAVSGTVIPDDFTLDDIRDRFPVLRGLTVVELHEELPGLALRFLQHLAEQQASGQDVDEVSELVSFVMGCLVMLGGNHSEPIRITPVALSELINEQRRSAT